MSYVYDDIKEKSLYGRYISLDMITPLLRVFKSIYEVSVIGHSVEDRPIYSIKLGSGKIKILIWSQMHGNESTTTKAVFDLINAFCSKNDIFLSILEKCELCIIPILNPDGAKMYSRFNANGVDLNRDAQQLSQPESKVLRQVFDRFNPNFCFNLHGQRTIFGVGLTGKPATLSFLSPAVDKDRLITATRKLSMAIIFQIYNSLQANLPGGIGRYDDGFNINCVGDTFQSLGVPTVLYEAGHYQKDYSREITRKYVFDALCQGLKAVSEDIDLNLYHGYFNIPENKKNFYDVIIRNGKTDTKSSLNSDVAFQFKEVLSKGKITFLPIVKHIGDLSDYFAHKDINANGASIFSNSNKALELGSEIDFVMLNNHKILLKS